ncbi:MAG: PAS domain-containing protein [Nitriliruptoraceae bacterium]|nr:PAS domain-containing protein [Nitriliruptoraceae bacterium]
MGRDGHTDARRLDAAEDQGADRARAILDLSGEGIVEVDAAGVVLAANAAMRRALHLDADPVGRRLIELVTASNVAMIEAVFSRLADPGSGIVRLPASGVRDGEQRWWQVTAEGRYRAGVLTGATLVVSDVTELTRRGRELETARAQLEQAHRLARFGHWRATPGQQLEWSPMIYEIFGIDPDVAPSYERFLSAVHPEDRSRIRAAAERALAGEGDFDEVHRVMRPDGTEVVVRERAQAVPGDDGQPDGLVGTVQDVTDEHRAAQQLVESRELLDRVLEATQDGWWEADLVRGAATHSAHWWALHGYEPGELPETPTTWRAVTDPADLPRVDEQLAQAQRDRRGRFDLRAMAVRRDGTSFPVRIRGRVAYDEHGATVRISGTTTDLSALVRAETLKDEFLATVSHELRTPLTSIGGAIELLDRIHGDPADAQGRQLLDMAARNVRRLRRLIDDLLDIDQLAAGEVELELQVESAASLVHRAVTAHEGFAASHDVRLELRPIDEGLTIRVDRHRMEQVLANYLSNATRFAPAGSTVEVSAVALDEDRVELAVTDRGPGVPEEFRERAFSRFAQAAPTDRRSRGGTGLGLAISREIVERHGGSVGYESRPGHTRFWVRLPVA